MELPRDIFELAHGHFSNAAATAAVRSADAMVKPRRRWTLSKSRIDRQAGGQTGRTDLPGRMTAAEIACHACLLPGSGGGFQFGFGCIRERSCAGSPVAQSRGQRRPKERWRREAKRSIGESAHYFPAVLPSSPRHGSRIWLEE